MEFIESEQRSLIALQGPTAIKALEEISSQKFADLFFMQTRVSSIVGVDGCRVTRCGYTGSKIIELPPFSSQIGWVLQLALYQYWLVAGEDGVEISIPSDKAAQVVDALLDSTQTNVQLAGLGARDSLRLEAGLCLYGNDIDQTTTPIEAALAWLVGKTLTMFALFTSTNACD